MGGRFFQLLKQGGIELGSFGNFGFAFVRTGSGG
jgi:hypothetical protein